MLPNTLHLKFHVYNSFMNTANRFEDKERLMLYDAIFAYGFNEIEPDFSNASASTRFALEVAFQQIQPSIASSIANIEKAKKRGEKGGAPFGNKNAQKLNPGKEVDSETTSRLNEKQPNRKKNYKINNNSSFKDSVSEVGAINAPPPPRITPEEMERVQSILPPAPIGADGKPDYRAQGMEFARGLEQRRLRV